MSGQEKTAIPEKKKRGRKATGRTPRFVIALSKDDRERLERQRREGETTADALRRLIRQAS